VLDSLVHREDAEVAGAAQAAMLEQLPQRAQRRGAAVGVQHHAVDEVRPGQVQHRSVDRLAAVTEEVIRLGAEQVRDRG
jgi:hypothetical protein